MLCFVEFVEVSCFVGGNECFRGAFDSLYVLISLGLKFVLCLSELDVVYHIHEVCFESIQIFMLRVAFSGFKSVFIVGSVSESALCVCWFLSSEFFFRGNELSISFV